MTRLRLFALCLPIAVLAGPALSQEATTVVATVNGQNITLGEMIAARAGLPEQATGLPDTAIWDMLLDQMIRQTAVAEEGQKTINARDEAILNIDRRAYLAGRALERVAEYQPSDAEISETYQRIFNGAEPQTEYHAAHILLKTKEAADDVIRELKEGAEFGKVAESRSVGPTGPNRGDLGWFTLDTMVQPFADAVAAMQPGQFSAEPVETEFGWHVIKLEGTRIMEAPGLDEVREQIVTQIRRERVDAEIQRVISGAKIERTEGLDPALLSRTDLLGN